MSLPDEHSIYALLCRVIRANFTRSHELFEKYNLYPGQPPLLLALYAEDGQSQAQLAQVLQVKPSTITMMIRRLHKSGLVTRMPDPHDKRIFRISLTEEGKALAAQLTQVNATNESICTQSMTTEEKIILRRLLLQLLENLSQPTDMPTTDSDAPYDSAIPSASAVPIPIERED